MLDRVYVTSCQKFVSNFFTVLELLWEKSRKRGVESKSAFSLHPALIPSRPVPLFPYGDFFCLHFSPLYEVSGLIYPRDPGGNSQKNFVGGLRPASQTPYPRPIYDQNSLFQTNGFIDNDENVASSKKNIHNLRLECENHILFMTKRAKIDALFVTKTDTNHIL